MKPFNGIPDFRKKEERTAEPTLTFKPCCVCNAVITTGYFGVWEEGGTCTKKCEATRQDMRLYLKEIP